MRTWFAALACGMLAGPVFADPSNELIFQLKASVVKVHVADKDDNHGIGSGVAVDQDHIITNCHVLANARGVSIRKFGVSHAPVAIKADWRHDLCMLRFEGADLQPVELGDAATLHYEQPVFTIGFPHSSPKPQVSFGKIKALYPLDDSRIIRSTASFRMGASGSPVFDDDGKLVGISTFKSPGRNSYYYNLPVDWVRKLLTAQETTSTKPMMQPFWDAPEAEQPYFMRVVLPMMGQRWEELQQVAGAWTQAEPANAEAWYYLGLSEDRLHRPDPAMTHYQHALALNPQHAGALFDLALLASREGNQVEYQRVAMLLEQLDRDTADELRNTVANDSTCKATC